MSDLPPRPAHRPPAGEGVSDDEFIAAWARCGGSPIRVSRDLGITERNIHRRRAGLRARGIDLPTEALNPGYVRPAWTYPREVALEVRGGCVLIGGDAHVWPGPPSPMWLAFCEIARRMKPAVTVLNGDMIDGTRVSRHPRLRGQDTPTVAQECEALRGWLGLLPVSPVQVWTVGNHDTRADAYLANMAPELDDWAGRLPDRFPAWKFTYSVTVNDTVEIRHIPPAGGIHAAYNSALKSGISTVTSHTHACDVRPVTDRRGTRYGVQAGTLNDPGSAVFEYGQGALSQQRPGFVVLTFSDEGRMMPPELCEWIGGGAVFRGAFVEARPRVRVKAGVVQTEGTA